MSAFKFYCRGCRKSFSTDSVNRRRMKGKKKGKIMIAWEAHCPKCGHQAYKVIREEKPKQIRRSRRR